MSNDTVPAVDDDGKAQAPWMQVPARSVAVVEHPCILKNLDKGLVSLGGPAKLSKVGNSYLLYIRHLLTLVQVLRSKAEGEIPAEDGEGPNTLKVNRFISVSLRPDDPFAKRLLATPITTNNLLLKVTVPKRTGRKRKRGSSGPFLTEQEIEAGKKGSSDGQTAPAPKSPYVDAETVFRCLRDNPTKYSVAPAGVIDETHRFRSTLRFPGHVFSTLTTQSASRHSASLAPEPSAEQYQRVFDAPEM
jgi:general transcription factor 3C polypeptide 5 (transcription factor C subunit 1)